MFTAFYEFSSCGKDHNRVRSHLVTTHLFRFKNHNGLRYIAEVEEYEHHFYAIKFFHKNHKLSPHRYQLCTNAGTPNRVLATCVQIMLHFYRKDSKASFGFIGANSLGEGEDNTQRFKIYSQIMKRFFSPVRFSHFQYVEKSVYLMLNQGEIQQDENFAVKIEQMFNQHFNAKI